MKLFVYSLSTLYVCAGIAGFTILTIVGKDTSDFVIFFITLLTTGLPQLFTLTKVHSAQQAVAEVKQVVDDAKDDMAIVKQAVSETEPQRQ